MTCSLRLLDRVSWRGDDVAGERLHTLLAALVSAGPAGVSTHRLQEVLWSDSPPADPRKALQVIVSRVRKLTAAEVVERAGTTYACRLPTEDVDAWRLSQLARRARRAFADQDWPAARELGEAVLAFDVAEPGDGPLEDLRRSAHEEIEACRALVGQAASRLGDHASALAILRPMVQEIDPAEPLLEAYLRSIAETDGAAEALTTYERYRHDLADRLGVSPGESLRQLHGDLLAADDPVREGLRYDDNDLVGRGADLARLGELLRTGRVVTVLGPGGLGKTRLAHVLGREATQPVVHFVELTGVLTPEAVVPAVAAAVGIRERTINRSSAVLSRDLRSRLLEKLATAPTLLILDNCEQVVDAVADAVANLVGLVPRLTVLTTSRIALGIRAEHVYPLPQLEQDDAVHLFVDRAQAARPGAELDHGLISALVERLDGLPLAIELAAARVRVMSVADIGRRLGERFSLLRAASRDAPERHQTLQAVIDWSWNLLDPVDRDALCALSCFHDGFDLLGAEAVLGEDALARVESLAAQSLLRVLEAPTVRYRMLETVREFGRARLLDAGWLEQAQGTIRAWALQLGRQGQRDAYGPRQIEAITRMAQEEGNLVAELDRALASGDASAAGVLGGALFVLWQINGDFLRAVGSMESITAVITGAQVAAEDADAVRNVLGWSALFQLLFRGSVDAAVRRSITELGPGEDRTIAAMITVALAMAEAEDGDLAADSRALAALTRSEDRLVAGMAARWCTHVAENAGDYPAALRWADLALACSDDAADGPWSSHNARAERAGLLAQSGRRTEAAADAARAVDVLVQVNAYEDAVQQQLLMVLGRVEIGDLTGAQERMDRLEQQGAAGTMRQGWGVFAQTNAEIAVARGDVEAAVHLHETGWRQMQDVTLPVEALFDSFQPWLLYGRAVVLHAYVMRDGPGIPSVRGREMYEECVVALAASLTARRTQLDYPSTGALLFSVARWTLAHDPGRRTDAAQMFLLAGLLGYNQMYPSMDWDRAVRDIETAAPGLLDQVRPSIPQAPADRFAAVRDLVGGLGVPLAGDQSLRR